jgi:hypothetical protein
LAEEFICGCETTVIIDAAALPSIPSTRFPGSACGVIRDYSCRREIRIRHGAGMIPDICHANARA